MLFQVFLNVNTTLKAEDIITNLKSVVAESPDIVVDIDTISMTKLENFTNTEAVLLLSQYGLLKNGFKYLDMQAFSGGGPDRFGKKNDYITYNTVE